MNLFPFKILAATEHCFGFQVIYSNKENMGVYKEMRKSQ